MLYFHKNNLLETYKILKVEKNIKNKVLNHLSKTNQLLKILTTMNFD